MTATIRQLIKAADAALVPATLLAVPQSDRTDLLQD